jgi:hypothetical protein
MRRLRINSNATTSGKDAGMTLKGKGYQNLELHENPVQPRAEGRSGNHALNADDIRRRAYEIHLERGALPGRELEDWLQAESELKSAALFIRATAGEKHRP